MVEDRENTEDIKAQDSKIFKIDIVLSIIFGLISYCLKLMLENNSFYDIRLGPKGFSNATAYIFTLQLILPLCIIFKYLCMLKWERISKWKFIMIFIFHISTVFLFFCCWDALHDIRYPIQTENYHRILESESRFFDYLDCFFQYLYFEYIFRFFLVALYMSPKNTLIMKILRFIFSLIWILFVFLLCASIFDLLDSSSTNKMIALRMKKLSLNNVSNDSNKNKNLNAEDYRHSPYTEDYMHNNLNDGEPKYKINNLSKEQNYDSDADPKAYEKQYHDDVESYLNGLLTSNIRR
ncbi:hypothetical protein HK407_01g00390 [Ordospora pajunii]|uniref:uncharacterized protein n=1 Tax=Ordospora pajunii TaxID=3039483 RepID=UPI00295278A4|nr:uncharacterized protein HK407_01g00390 [Ordospora pajunii]KAH9412147.1 hypothetical protein HK407_01g00390 [Ordospora pajunii]